MEAFNSLNSFIDRRLEVLVGFLLPWAADPVICSALNALATGATDFTCKAWVRASIAAPLIGRFATAVLRCALERGCQQGGTCRQLPGSHMEAVCNCLRMAFKSLDDALRIVASSPNGHTDFTRRADVHNLATVSQCTCRFFAAHALPAAILRDGPDHALDRKLLLTGSRASTSIYTCLIFLRTRLFGVTKI